MEPSGNGSSVPSCFRRLIFSGRLPGTWSEPKAVRLTNRGPIPLLIKSAKITGLHHGDFAICAEDFSGVHLHPGSSCSVFIRFRPSETGWRTAELLLYGQGRKRPWRIRLIGYGAALELVNDCLNRAVRMRDLMTVTVAAVGRCGEPNLIWGKAAMVPGRECERELRQELTVAVPISVHVQAHCDDHCEPVTAVFHSVAVQKARVTVPIHVNALTRGSRSPLRPQPDVPACQLHVVQRLEVEVPVVLDSSVACG